MKRTLIPQSTADRIGLSLTLLITIPGILFGVRFDDRVITIISVVGIAYGLLMAYVFQDQVSNNTSVNEYSEVIGRISAIGKQLSDLSTFLERERKRVAATEATVRKLTDEKTKLEPVVNTQRETVEAILAAHAARTVRQAWKERLMGFVLGVVASLIASFVYEYFKR